MNVALAVTRSCPHCPSIEAELKKMGIPYSIRYMEDDVKLQNKHNIKGSPNILVDGELVFNGIDQGMLLDASGHTKMAVGHQFHFGQHGQHSGYGKNAGQHAAGGGHYGNGLNNDVTWQHRSNFILNLQRFESKGRIASPQNSIFFKIHIKFLF